MLKQLEDMQILLLRLCFTYVLMIFRYALCLFFHSLIYWQTFYAVIGYCTVSVTHIIAVALGFWLYGLLEIKLWPAYCSQGCLFNE